MAWFIFSSTASILMASSIFFCASISYGSAFSSLNQLSLMLTHLDLPLLLARSSLHTSLLACKRFLELPVAFLDGCEHLRISLVVSEFGFVRTCRSSAIRFGSPSACSLILSSSWSLLGRFAPDVEVEAVGWPVLTSVESS
jgi:hypothetical protein